ncbi:protein fuzzy homolog isoform X2 [Ammospiza caudacuta]|uniref:protein fuzzy homolog isoform X2 n=1 Tax=Ammospiza caudacuta TaxID=2857398 RepID=UPI002738F33E|nr:protein fuzzy homolog isoform X2 [Ammospiza caudacuta]
MLEDDVTPCLVGVATASGLPLFCRPPRPQLPFSLVGALHGVRLFGAAAGAELREAATPTASLAWAQYGNSLTLVALSPSPGPAGPALQRILQSALGTLVLILGQEELLPIRNVERLKRDLRGCFPLLDSLLRPRGGGGEGWGMGGPCWPLPPGTPRQALQERLQRFAAAAQTELGCLLCAGGVAWLGTAHWGALPDDDSAHLRALLATPPPPGGGAGVGVAARDVAVFLPNSSPKVPLRLLWLRLLPGVGAGLLCGPRPSLHHVIGQVPPDPSGAEPERDRQGGGAGRGSAPPAPPRGPQGAPDPPGTPNLPQNGGPRTPPNEAQTLLPGLPHAHRVLPPPAGADAAAAAAPRHPPRAPEPHSPERPERAGVRLKHPENTAQTPQKYTPKLT